MVKQLSTAPEWLWYDTVDPGLSETNVSQFNWWLNTSSGDIFSCLDATIGAQAWEKLVLQNDNFSSANITMSSGSALRTSTGAGNTLLIRAYDTDTGPAYVTFITLTAGTSPTCDLSDSVTKASGYIYRGGGTDVPVADGGTGLSTLTAHSLQVGNGASSPTQLSVGATGTVLTGSTGADPVFSAAPALTSVAIGTGGLTITSGSGAPATTQPKGSLYLRTDGGAVNDRMYVATDSAGAWTAVITVA